MLYNVRLLDFQALCLAAAKKDFAFKAPSRRFERRLGNARGKGRFSSLTGRRRVLGVFWAYLAAWRSGKKKPDLEGRARWDAKEGKIVVYAGTVVCLLFSRSISIA